ncbi:MAG: YlxM family DNA-binding protein [Clostridia bacterium]|nr:YlxM family DNA-binding protein [Clostridia bacterium]
MLDKYLQTSLLFDFYGQLLSKRQREVMSLYHEENLSLAEIAAEFNITRAAVFDSLKKAQKALEDYEEKLGLVERFVKTREAIEKIDEIIDGLKDERLKEVKKIIDELEG